MAVMARIEPHNPPISCFSPKTAWRSRQLIWAGAGGFIGIFAGGSSLAADWKITPALGIQELVTDNVNQSQFSTRADAISQVIPSVTITGDSPRGKVDFYYAPIVSIDLTDEGQDRVDQSLYGNGSVNIIDRLLTVDFTLFANQGSASGNFGSPGASGLVPLSDRTLSYGGKFAPHFQQHFSDIATLDAYYRVSSSNTSGNNQQDSPFGDVSDDQLEQEAEIIVGSGDSFGRLSGQLDLDHSFGSGTGANTKFDNDRDIVKFQYHVSHQYAVTGYVGYQRIHYDAMLDSAGYDSEGLTWNAGIDVTPNDFTAIEIGYGQQSGSYGLDVHIKYDLTPRTHISGNYTITVENQLQANLQNLQFVSHNSVGNPIDIRNGLGYNNTDSQFFGQQNSLFRDKQATFSFTREFTRSSVTVSVGNEQRAALSGIQTSDNAWYGQITYNRDLTPSLSGYADINYSTQSSNGLLSTIKQQDNNINADISLTYQINPKLSTTATYSLIQRSSNVDGLNATTNQFIIGIRKEF